MCPTLRIRIIQCLLTYKSVIYTCKVTLRSNAITVVVLKSYSVLNNTDTKTQGLFQNDLNGLCLEYSLFYIAYVLA